MNAFRSLKEMNIETSSSLLSGISAKIASEKNRRFPCPEMKFLSDYLALIVSLP